jgi:uncharacterized membrane protein
VHRVTVIRSVVLIAATISTGLIAGLMYTFAIAVMPGLKRTDDRTFVTAMQWINIRIVNGWFLLCYLGALLLIVVAGVLAFTSDESTLLPWLISAFVLYGATLAITGAANIPLNNQLDEAGPPDQIADLAAVRQRFEAPWLRWHAIRTFTAIAAFGCLAWTLVLYGGQ